MYVERGGGDWKAFFLPCFARHVLVNMELVLLACMNRYVQRTYYRLDYKSQNPNLELQTKSDFFWGLYSVFRWIPPRFCYLS